MIVVYRLDRPFEVFATHDNWQQEDVIATYSSSEYGGLKIPGPQSIYAGDEFNPAEGTEIF